jgi:hypothetical protein
VSPDTDRITVQSKDQDMNAPVHYCDPPDIPEGMTIEEYRRARCTPPTRRGMLRRWARRRLKPAAASRRA